MRSIRVIAICATYSVMPAIGQIVINEFQANPSERIVKWDENGVPSVGSGIVWYAPEFEDGHWGNGKQPFGSRRTGLSTNLTSQMRDKAHSLYLRKEFTVDATTAASNGTLRLSINYDDGFVAYLNGVEIARKNTGPSRHHIYAKQRAYNASTGGGNTDIDIGACNEHLVSGINLLAIQVHNHTINGDLYLKASLKTLDPSTTLVASGSQGGFWSYFVGHHEPSGIVTDAKLVTDPFPPPVGKEDDYKDPEEARDWVELHNSGPAPFDLSGCFLSDDENEPQKWAFPAGTTIPADGYLLVLCDNRFEANGLTADHLHSNFGLSSEGGALELRQGTDLLDSIIYPGGQTPHHSYGRNPANGDWVFLPTATPEAANQGPAYIDKCKKPNTFGADGVTPLEGGFYDDSQTVVLSTSTEAATIRYTLDGSDPVETSTLYTEPLVIQSIDSKTGTVLRARAFKLGYVPSKITTRTFLISQDPAIQTLPAMVMTGNEGRVWYSETGLLSIEGGSYGGDGVWQPNGPESYNIPGLTGATSERLAYLEYMHPDGSTEGFNLHAGVRLSASSWTTGRVRYDSPHDSPWIQEYQQKPSFNLFFRGAYGKKKLEYPLLAGYDVNRFDQLRLRAGKNDISNPHIVDELCRRIFTAMGNEGSTGNWCTLYVNGSFKGYYNLCERLREPFFQEHYNSDLPWDVISDNELKNGSMDAYNTLINTDLARNLSNLANYNTVSSKLDIDNVCDYYLMKIYTAMWDWPHHNWCLAREQSDGPNGRFRFADWDSEGGFQTLSYSEKGVAYDTIGNDLQNNSLAISYMFKRLILSEEFRMAFADRIQLHFFDGGVLDDRASQNPDFWLKESKEELMQVVSPIIQYVTGEEFEEEWFDAWTNESTGRRSHLFGAGPASFITHGLWPATAAASFSIDSGSVAFEDELSLSAAQGTIYYTVDGSDPRLAGGGVSAAASIYTTPVSLTQSGTIKARVLHNGIWSPITWEYYFVGSVEPAVGKLAIAELMYHGAPPTSAEAALGYDEDSFDYCRVKNISSDTITTVGLSFEGITCVLPVSDANVPALQPDESFLVVRDINAFQYRYGNDYDGMIAAEYSKNLSNSGELLKLIYTPIGGGSPVDIVSFTYGDSAPWPTPPDRYGPSLLLIEPENNPDPNLSTNWEVSAGVGGQPGGEPLDTNWAMWAGLAFPAAEPAASKDPEADPDGDGISNALEYALGTSPQLKDDGPQRLPQLAWVEDGGEIYLGLDCFLSIGAVDATIAIETSGTLDEGSWNSGAGHSIEAMIPIDWSDGSRSLRHRDAVPFGTPGQSKRFIRMSVDTP